MVANNIQELSFDLLNSRVDLRDLLPVEGLLDQVMVLVLLVFGLHKLSDQV